MIATTRPGLLTHRLHVDIGMTFTTLYQVFAAVAFETLNDSQWFITVLRLELLDNPVYIKQVAELCG